MRQLTISHADLFGIPLSLRPPQLPVVAPPGNTDTGSLRKSNPVLGILRYIYWGTDSSYNAMYVNVQKRL